MRGSRPRCGGRTRRSSGTSCCQNQSRRALRPAVFPLPARECGRGGRDPGRRGRPTCAGPRRVRRPCGEPSRADLLRRLERRGDVILARDRNRRDRLLGGGRQHRHRPLRLGPLPVDKHSVVAHEPFGVGFSTPFSPSVFRHRNKGDFSPRRRGRTQREKSPKGFLPRSPAPPR